MSTSECTTPCCGYETATCGTPRNSRRLTYTCHPPHEGGCPGGEGRPRSSLLVLAPRARSFILYELGYRGVKRSGVGRIDRPFDRSSARGTTKTEGVGVLRGKECSVPRVTHPGGLAGGGGGAKRKSRSRQWRQLSETRSREGTIVRSRKSNVQENREGERSDERSR